MWGRPPRGRGWGRGPPPRGPPLLFRPPPDPRYAFRGFYRGGGYYDGYYDYPVVVRTVSYSPPRGGAAIREVRPLHVAAETGANTKKFAITLPLDIIPGQTFRASLDGVEMLVQCPEYCKPGERIIVVAPLAALTGSSAAAAEHQSIAVRLDNGSPASQQQAQPFVCGVATVLQSKSDGHVEGGGAYSFSHETSPPLAAAIVCGGAGAGSGSACPSCTFQNKSNESVCEICGTGLGMGGSGAATSFWDHSTHLPVMANAVVVGPSTVATPSLPSSPPPPTWSSWAMSEEDRRQAKLLMDECTERRGTNLSSEQAFEIVRGLTRLTPLAPHILAQLWVLADVNREGSLDEWGWGVFLFLVRRAIEGSPVPPSLPPGLARA